MSTASIPTSIRPTEVDANVRRPVCLLTSDVETHSIWHNRLRDETGARVLVEGMPALLDLYERYGITATFYFTGTIARKFPEIVRMVVPGGHEVGCHGYSHEVDESFDVLSYAEQVDHLRRAKGILEDLSGVEVISFRAPALRVNRDTPRALIETGFHIDSSVASQRFDFFMSFGGLNKLGWMGAPRLPYRTRPDDLHRRGDGPLVEIPLSAFLFPYVGTTLRMLPALTRLVRSGLDLEARRTGKPIVFDMHPNELIDEREGRRTIARRARHLPGYLLQDVLRGALKVRNLGQEALTLYEHEIRRFRERGFAFGTVQQYCRSHGFIR